MSGRTRHLRAGELITNRKTDRRNPRRDPRDVLHALTLRALKTAYPVRLALRLPKTLEAFVTPGAHGINVEVLKGGFVRIASHSAEQCFHAARQFFSDVAKERPAFTALAVVIDAGHPEHSYGRHLTVVRGNVIVTGGHLEPRIYEAA